MLTLTACRLFTAVEDWTKNQRSSKVVTVSSLRCQAVDLHS